MSSPNAAPDMLSDLILRIATGDRDAFRLLYAATSNRLFASAMRIVRNRSLAEDVMQDTFIRVWRYSKTFKPDRAEPLAWLTQIMRNRAIDLRTSHGKEVSLSNDDLVDSLSNEDGSYGSTSSNDADDNDVDSVTYEIHDAALAGCFEQLGGRARQVLYLSFTFGMSHAEIAAHMHIPLGTAKTWCRKALIELKKQLELVEESRGHRPSPAALPVASQVKQQFVEAI